MSTELSLLALLAASLAVTWVCRRVGVSAPLVLVVAGIGASLIPGVGYYEMDPHLVLLLVLTPLLYSAALGSSYRGIRANRRGIALLAVGLVAFTAVVVGVVAWWAAGLSFAAALALGAVVAPPDAVSALAVGRRLGLPRRVMTILGGESLLNDATALTLLTVFLSAATGEGTTPLGGVGMFVYASAGGTAIGLAVGWLVHRVRRRLDDPPVESALGLIVPFGVYLLAEAAHTSGLLAVVVAGLYLGHHAPESGYATRLQEDAVWRASDTILESIVFALIGLQLTAVVTQAGARIGPLVLAGLAVTAATVLARPLWVFPATYVPRALFKGVRERDPYPPWQVPAVISWSGMRGVVTLAAAFAIGPEVPGRETIVFLAFFVTVATLLLHGLTLPAVIRRLGVRDNAAQDDLLAEAQAQYSAARAAIDRLDELTAGEPDGSGVRHTAEKLRRLAELRANSVWERLGRPEAEAGESPGAAYRRLRREMLTRERTEFVARRDAGEIDDEVLRRVLHELDLEEATLARDER